LSRSEGVRSRKVLIVTVAALALTMGAVASYVTSRKAAPQIEGLLWPQSKALKAFALEDHRREPFTLERMTGRWTLLFFGYTHCPDVCPVTMSVLKNAIALMAEAGSANEVPQVVFVSVDPARDTAEHMAGYVGHFSPAFLGVTGDDANLKEFARQLGVLYIRAEPDTGGSYLVDHTAAVFLIDPRGHLVALFQAPQEAQRIARDVSRIRDLEWN